MVLGFVSDGTMPVQSMHPSPEQFAALKVLDKLTVSSQIDKQPEIQPARTLQQPVKMPARKVLEDSSAHMGNQKQTTSFKGNIRPERKFSKADMDPIYVELVKNNRDPDSGHKLTLEPTLDQCIRIKPEEILDVSKCFGHALVGYFPTRHPGKSNVQKLCASWKVQHDIIHNVNGWITFIFKSQSDRDKVSSGGPYSVGGHTLLLKELPEWFKFGEDDIKTAPIWVILPNLPLECWSPKILSRIASKVGTPLVTDKLTKTMQRISYARLLVDVDVTKNLLNSVEIIDTRGISFHQKVEYEYVPKFCTLCNRIGHSAEACRKKGGNACKPTAEIPPTDCPPAAGVTTPPSPVSSPPPATQCTVLTGPAQINSFDPIPADGDSASRVPSDPENDGSPHGSIASDETEYAQFETVGKKNRIVKLQVGPRNIRGGAELSNIIFRDRTAQERARAKHKDKESGPRAEHRWK
ncbi:hypothetical protein OROHE_003467 [Orobanche hederae]